MFEFKTPESESERFSGQWCRSREFWVSVVGVGNPLLVESDFGNSGSVGSESNSKKLQESESNVFFTDSAVLVQTVSKTFQ